MREVSNNKPSRIFRQEQIASIKFSMLRADLRLLLLTPKTINKASMLVAIAQGMRSLIYTIRVSSTNGLCVLYLRVVLDEMKYHHAWSQRLPVPI